MIPTEGYRQLSFLDMVPNSLGNCTADFGYKPWVQKFAYRRVIFL